MLRELHQWLYVCLLFKQFGNHSNKWTTSVAFHTLCNATYLPYAMQHIYLMQCNIYTLCNATYAWHLLNCCKIYYILSFTIIFKSVIIFDHLDIQTITFKLFIITTYLYYYFHARWAWYNVTTLASNVTRLASNVTKLTSNVTKWQANL